MKFSFVTAGPCASNQSRSSLQMRFRTLKMTLSDPLSALKRAFLSPKNANVDEFNSTVLDLLPSEERVPLTPLLTVLLSF
jgi:hypothetical protein